MFSEQVYEESKKLVELLGEISSEYCSSKCNETSLLSFSSIDSHFLQSVDDISSNDGCSTSNPVDPPKSNDYNYFPKEQSPILQKQQSDDAPNGRRTGETQKVILNTSKTPQDNYDCSSGKENCPFYNSNLLFNFQSSGQNSVIDSIWQRNSRNGNGISIQPDNYEAIKEADHCFDNQKNAVYVSQSVTKEEKQKFGQNGTYEKDNLYSSSSFSEYLARYYGNVNRHGGGKTEEKGGMCPKVEPKNFDFGKFVTLSKTAVTNESSTETESNNANLPINCTLSIEAESKRAQGVSVSPMEESSFFRFSNHPIEFDPSDKQKSIFIEQCNFPTANVTSGQCPWSNVSHAPPTTGNDVIYPKRNIRGNSENNEELNPKDDVDSEITAWANKYLQKCSAKGQSQTDSESALKPKVISNNTSNLELTARCADNAERNELKSPGMNNSLYDNKLLSRSTSWADSITYVFVNENDDEFATNVSVARSKCLSLLNSVSLDSLEKTALQPDVSSHYSPRTLSVDSLTAEDLFYQIRKSKFPTLDKDPLHRDNLIEELRRETLDQPSNSDHKIFNFLGREDDTSDDKNTNKNNQVSDHQSIFTFKSIASCKINGECINESDEKIGREIHNELCRSDMKSINTSSWECAKLPENKTLVRYEADLSYEKDLGGIRTTGNGRMKTSSPKRSSSITDSNVSHSFTEVRKSTSRTTPSSEKMNDNGIRTYNDNSTQTEIAMDNNTSKPREILHIAMGLIDLACDVIKSANANRQVCCKYCIHQKEELEGLEEQTHASTISVGNSIGNNFSPNQHRLPVRKNSDTPKRSGKRMDMETDRKDYPGNVCDDFHVSSHAMGSQNHCENDLAPLSNYLSDDRCGVNLFLMQPSINFSQQKKPHQTPKRRAPKNISQRVRKLPQKFTCSCHDEKSNTHRNVRSDDHVPLENRSIGSGTAQSPSRQTAAGANSRTNSSSQILQEISKIMYQKTQEQQLRKETGESKTNLENGNAENACSNLHNVSVDSGNCSMYSPVKEKKDFVHADNQQAFCNLESQLSRSAFDWKRSYSVSGGRESKDCRMHLGTSDFLHQKYGDQFRATEAWDNVAKDVSELNSSGLTKDGVHPFLLSSNPLGRKLPLPLHENFLPKLRFSTEKRSKEEHRNTSADLFKRLPQSVIYVNSTFRS